MLRMVIQPIQIVIYETLYVLSSQGLHFRSLIAMIECAELPNPFYSGAALGKGGWLFAVVQMHRGYHMPNTELDIPGKLNWNIQTLTTALRRYVGPVRAIPGEVNSSIFSTLSIVSTLFTVE